MNDLLAFLNAQLDQDELWALAASAPHHGGGPTVAGGVHWTWAVGDDWDPIDVDPTVSYLGEPHDTSVSLVTREEFPLDWSPRGLNNRVLDSDEMRTGEAGHIVRWDPARVLAEIEAKRRVLAAWSGADEQFRSDRNESGYAAAAEALDCVVRELAQPYAGRPGWREEWSPGPNQA